jgi:hypothetical protein
MGGTVETSQFLRDQIVRRVAGARWDCSISRRFGGRGVNRIHRIPAGGPRSTSSGGTVPAMPLDVFRIGGSWPNGQCSGKFAQLWPRLVQPSDSRTAGSDGNNLS